MPLTITQLEESITTSLEQWRGITREVILTSHDVEGNQIEVTVTLRNDEAIDENGNIVSKENSDTGKMLDAEANSIATAIVDNIKGTLEPEVIIGTETEGSTNEIIELKDEVEKLRSLLFNLCTIFVNWVPVSMDGGASLKAAILSTATTGVFDMTAMLPILQTFNYEAMDKNII